MRASSLVVQNLKIEGSSDHRIELELKSWGVSGFKFVLWNTGKRSHPDKSLGILSA